MQSLLVNDDESIIRMTFSPESYQDGEFLPSAVSLDDLKARGFSVDRESITTLAVVRERIETQQQKKPEDRHFPIFSKLSCAAIRVEAAEDQQTMFVVEALPDGKNDGHAVIKSAIPRGKGELRKLRNRLIQHLNNVVPLESLQFPEG